MERTMIVSVFAGCGKTWLTEHQDKLGYSVCDSDSSRYEKKDGWEVKYVDNVIDKVMSGLYDFVFVCQTESVLYELDKRDVPYVIVEPDNIIWNEFETEDRKKERQLIKQQWFGRFALRDNSHIHDFSKWLEHIKEIYDDRTGLAFIERHKPITFFVLKQDQYLSDIIRDLDWKRNTYGQYTMQTGSHSLVQIK